jgi:hypothetical protein
MDLATKGLSTPGCAELFGSRSDGMTAAEVLAGTASGVTWTFSYTYNTNAGYYVALTAPTISITNLFGFHSLVTTINANKATPYWAPVTRRKTRILFCTNWGTCFETSDLKVETLLRMTTTTLLTRRIQQWF